jgi:hypothetical protein
LVPEPSTTPIPPPPPVYNETEEEEEEEEEEEDCYVPGWDPSDSLRDSQRLRLRIRSQYIRRLYWTQGWNVSFHNFCVPIISQDQNH